MFSNASTSPFFRLTTSAAWSNMPWSTVPATPSIWASQSLTPATSSLSIALPALVICFSSAPTAASISSLIASWSSTSAFARLRTASPPLVGTSRHPSCSTTAACSSTSSSIWCGDRDIVAMRCRWSVWPCASTSRVTRI